MLYKFFNSKKGFTVIEILIVVIILGILISIAIPAFDKPLKTQKKKDCRNQALVIETAVKQTMFGMIDNGKRQEEIDIAHWADGGEFYKKQYTPDDPSFPFNIDSEYEYKYFTKLDDKLTIGKIRGGYRDINQYPDYKDGCSYDSQQNPNGTKFYLKKQRLENIAFYTCLDNKEIPVCPFADFTNSSTDDDYFYCIFYDGTVCCTCPECNR